MAVMIPGIDAASGLDLCDGNMDIYRNALRLYVSDIPADLENMKGVSAETLGAYAITVHSVKSMSQYIGAEEARKTAKELEALAKSGDLATVLAKNDTFIKYAQGIVDSVRDWLENNQP